MDRDDTIDTLNKLIETSKDGEYGFRSCAEQARSEDIRSLLMRRSEDCREAATELQALVSRLGGQAETAGSASGAVHRGWVAVKATLSGYTDKSVLEEAERGEDVALAAYRRALEDELPLDVRSVVERQMQGVQKAHNQVRALRDQARAAST